MSSKLYHDPTKFTSSTGESIESLKLRADKSLSASWKYLPRRLDATPKVSMSQETTLVVIPVPGTNTKPICVQHEFCKYLDKVNISKILTLYTIPLH